MLKIAVLIPCYNEQATIGSVVNDFRKALPDADIYVYDNNSIDNTINEAITAGAIVRKESRQGKGNVVRTMFREVKADVYVMADGDGTYPAAMAPIMINELLNSGADMVVGDRLSGGDYKKENKRPFHEIGNAIVVSTINRLFHSNIRDVMSGYRVFSQDFIKNFPTQSPGFEIETEMILYALNRRYVVKEMPINYLDRPPGSVSKLNTFTDGQRVLLTIASLYCNYRPLKAFGFLSVLFAFIGICLGSIVIWEFITTRYITHVPTAILASGVMILSFFSLGIGIILNLVVYHFDLIQEQIFKINKE